MNKRFKGRQRHVMRVSFEPDHDHDAWSSDTSPTPATVPDAFYKVSVPARPVKPSPLHARRNPHSAVTAGMLRKRLYQAGVRGIEAKRILAEIMAGEPLGAEDGVSMPMAWRVKNFHERFGRRVARAVLRFVQIRLIVLDEFAYYAQPSLAEFVQKAMSVGRKHSAAPILVEQVVPATPVVRRISFHY